MASIKVLDPLYRIAVANFGEFVSHACRKSQRERERERERVGLYLLLMLIIVTLHDRPMQVPTSL